MQVFIILVAHEHATYDIPFSYSLLPNLVCIGQLYVLPCDLENFLLDFCFLQPTLQLMFLFVPTYILS